MLALASHCCRFLVASSRQALQERVRCTGVEGFALSIVVCNGHQDEPIFLKRLPSEPATGDCATFPVVAICRRLAMVVVVAAVALAARLPQHRRQR